MAALLAAFGALLALLGHAGGEWALTSLGTMIVAFAAIWAFAADAIGVAAGFANSRPGRLTICTALFVMAVLVLGSHDAVALLR